MGKLSLDLEKGSEADLSRYFCGPGYIYLLDVEVPLRYTRIIIHLLLCMLCML